MNKATGKKILTAAIACFGLVLWQYFTDPDFNRPGYFFIAAAVIFFLAFSDFTVPDFRKRSALIFIGLFSLFLSAALVVKSHVVIIGGTRGKIDQNYMLDFGKNDLVWILVIAAVLAFLLYRLLRLACAMLPRIKEENQQHYSRISVFLIFLSFVLVWGIAYLSFWPGTDMWNDINAILVHGPIAESYRSPVIFNLIVYFCIVTVGGFFGSPNIGFALFTLIQLLVMACTAAYLVWWADQRRVNKILRTALYLYLLFFPYISLYAITVDKDVYFSLCITLWLPLLYDWITEEKLSRHNRILFVILIFGTLTMRNNGKIIIPLLLLILFLACRKNRKFLAAAGLTAVILTSALTGFLTRNVEYRFAEGVSLPLQQIAMTLTDNGKISDEDRAFLYRIKKEEYWTGTDNHSYAPLIVDPLKMGDSAIEINSSILDDAYLNAHKDQFIKVYLHILRDNPKSCIKAWLFETYGFWAFGTESDEQAYLLELQENDFGLYQETKLPEGFNKRVQEYFERVAGGSGSAGTIFWLILFIDLIFIAAGKRRYILITLPMLLNWAVLMLCTPIAFAYRYVFYYMLSVPVLICLLPGILHRKTEK